MKTTPWLSSLAHRNEAHLVAAFEKCGAAVQRTAPCDWVLSSVNGSTAAVYAHVQADWLVLQGVGLAADGSAVELAPADDDLRWRLLRCNAALAGGAKWALGPDPLGVHLRAEVPLDDDIDFARRIGDAYVGIAASAALGCGPGAHADTAAPSGVAVPAIDLAAWCQTTVWPSVVRAAHEITIDLQLPGAFRQATITTRPDGKIAASVDLNGRPAEPPSPVCRTALAEFLLRIGALVRMARAAAAGETPRFEVVFADAPASVELCHALAALSVASRLAAHEAEVLTHDEEVARAYLSTHAGYLSKSFPSFSVLPVQWQCSGSLVPPQVGTSVHEAQATTELTTEGSS